MTTTEQRVPRLWRRELSSYPTVAPRIGYLSLAVFATVILYYQLYVGSSVSTLILDRFHMSFTFYVVALAIGSLIGAFGSLLAGVTDRFGRANLVVCGLFLAGALTALAIPASPNKWVLTLFTFAVGAVAGFCLTATPALVRDFSPQVGRATAMGFWTAGPVLGSLLVSVVASHTVGANPSSEAWAHEFRIAGIIGLGAAVIALLWMRELRPSVRDQVMVDLSDQALVEVRADQIDTDAAVRHPWRQLLKVDVLIPALGYSLFLVYYVTAIGFGLIFFTTVLGFSIQGANSLNNWAWGFDAIAVILVGFLSDRIRVRKPLILIGAVATAVLILVYSRHARANLPYHDAAIALAVIAFFGGISATPWMAAFTETVEERNPALTATGLAIMGWTSRVVGMVAFLLIPLFVTSVTPIVDYGTTVQAAAVRFSTELAFSKSHPQVVTTAKALAPELQAIQQHQALFTELAASPTLALLDEARNAVGNHLLSQIIANKSEINSITPYSTQLQALKAAESNPDFQVLTAHGAEVANAKQSAPGEWKRWYFVCFCVAVLFILTVPFLRGRWRPKSAKADREAHDALVSRELAELRQAARTTSP